MSNNHGHAAAAPAAKHGGTTSYIVGFLLSLLLTALSFGAVMSGALPHDTALVAIVVLAAVQLVVQLVFFLHLGAGREQRRDTVIFILTGFLILTIVGLSLWVMRNANRNMMPTQITTERALSRD